MSRAHASRLRLPGALATIVATSVVLPVLPVTLVTSVGLGIAAVAPRPADYFEAAARHLQRAATTQRDGSHLLRLFGLRQLRDPDLRPLFERLVQSSEWTTQVHAVLGLAEVAPADAGGGLDPWIVARLDATAQEAVVASAADAGLLEPVLIRELLGRDELHAMPKLMLLGELHLAGASIDPRLPSRLAAVANPQQSGLAAMLLAQSGDPAALSALEERLGKMRGVERDRLVHWLLEAARQYRLTAVTPWVLASLDRMNAVGAASADDALHTRMILTALALDPAAAMPYWRRALSSSPGYRERVNMAMVLLAAGPGVPESAYAAVRPASDDEVLLARMIEAGVARSRGDDPSAALKRLVDGGHLRSARWVMSILPELPPAQAIAVYEHVIDAAESDAPGRAERVSRAVEAAAALFDLDPVRIRARIDAADDDSGMQEVLLLGLFGATAPEAGRAAAGVRRIGAGRADTLALLLVARHGRDLSRDDVERLGRIAGGGGSVSEGLQAQAAWLYLKHTNRAESALQLAFESP